MKELTALQKNSIETRLTQLSRELLNIAREAGCSITLNASNYKDLGLHGDVCIHVDGKHLLSGYYDLGYKGILSQKPHYIPLNKGA